MSVLEFLFNYGLPIKQIFRACKSSSFLAFDFLGLFWNMRTLVGSLFSKKKKKLIKYFLTVFVQISFSKILMV